MVRVYSGEMLGSKLQPWPSLGRASVSLLGRGAEGLMIVLSHGMAGESTK